MKEEKTILYSSDEAATYRTGIEGWVSSDGRFWGKDEHMARYSGCTHKACECGKLMDRHYLKCEDCRNKSEQERFNALPVKEWDGEEFLYSYAADKYFFSPDDLEEYMEEEEVSFNDLRLVVCEENYLNTVELDGEFPCDYDMEDVVDASLLKILDELNAKISEHKPISYSPGKVRVVLNSDKNHERSVATEAP